MYMFKDRSLTEWSHSGQTGMFIGFEENTEQGSNGRKHGERGSSLAVSDLMKRYALVLSQVSFFSHVSHACECQFHV